MVIQKKYLLHTAF